MSCKAKLSDDGTHYLLNGEKMWVTNGAQADIIVLFAKDVDHPDYGTKKHGGTTAFIVDANYEGFSVGKKGRQARYSLVRHVHLGARQLQGSD